MSINKQNSLFSHTFLATFLLVGSISIAGLAALDQWEMITVGDTQDNGWGTNWGDINGDGYMDLVGNGYIFVSPGGDLTGSWQRKNLPQGKGYFIYDVDEDGIKDVVGNENNTLYWFRVKDTDISGFETYTVATNIVPDHNTFEGYVMFDFVAGGQKEFMVAFGDASWNFYTLPSNPKSTWPSTRVCGGALDEGIGVGDIDDDGDLDVAGGLNVRWWENPGNGGANWTEHNISTGVGRRVDRCTVADIDGDGDKDIYIGCHDESNNVEWYENPGDPSNTNWTKHPMTSVSGQCHGADAADLDGDGDVDAVASSTTGNYELRVYENDGSGNFDAAVLAGNPNGDGHNTLKLVDLDNDNDYEIITIGWLNKNLRVWRNDNEHKGEIPCDPYRMISCDTEVKPNSVSGDMLSQSVFSVISSPEQISIFFPENGAYSVRLYDSHGKTIARASVNSGRHIEIRPALARGGVYYMETKGTKGIQRQKIFAAR